MEASNVNNLNGVPNFGHGFPESLSDLTAPNMDNDEKEIPEDVPAPEAEAEEINGE